MNIKALSICCGLVLSGCVTANSYEQSLPIAGTTFSNTYVVQNGRVAAPLPDGEWTVVGTGLFFNNNRTPIEQISLAKIVDNKLEGLIEIQASVTVAKYGFTLSSFCSSEYIHFVETKKSAIGALQECYGVNHHLMTLSHNNAAEFRRETMNYIIENDISMPINMLSANYHFADQSYSLIVVYYKNPELSGFEPPKQAEWRSSDWHKDRVYLDTQKVEFVQNLIEWTKEYEPFVKAGFEGDLSP